MGIENSENLDKGRNAVTRRTAIAFTGAALAGAAGVTASSQAIRAEHEGHAHHDHAGHEGHGKDSQHQALTDAAMHCVSAGEACVPHCVELLAKGDTSLGECLESVLVMMPMCTAVARASGFDADRLKEMAKLCGDICADCEKVCREHAEHHAVCKACADSCAAFVKEARKLT